MGGGILGCSLGLVGVRAARRVGHAAEDAGQGTLRGAHHNSLGTLRTLLNSNCFLFNLAGVSCNT